MSLTFTRAGIKALFETGDVPTQSDFSTFIDAFPMIYSETVTLVADTDMSVTHDAGEKARIVQVLNSDGEELGVSWRRDPDDETNKVIINSGVSKSNVEINILLKG